MPFVPDVPFCTRNDPVFDGIAKLPGRQLSSHEQSTSIVSWSREMTAFGTAKSRRKMVAPRGCHRRRRRRVRRCRIGHGARRERHLRVVLRYRQQRGLHQHPAQCCRRDRQWRDRSRRRAARRGDCRRYQLHRLNGLGVDLQSASSIFGDGNTVSATGGLLNWATNIGGSGNIVETTGSLSNTATNLFGSNNTVRTTGGYLNWGRNVLGDGNTCRHHGRLCQLGPNLPGQQQHRHDHKRIWWFRAKSVRRQQCCVL